MISDKPANRLSYNGDLLHHIKRSLGAEQGLLRFYALTHQPCLAAPFPLGNLLPNGGITTPDDVKLTPAFSKAAGAKYR